MEIVRLLLVAVHVLGLALIIGPFASQVRRKAHLETGVMLAGAVTQLLTGLALVGVREAGDLPVDHAKIGVKLVVSVLVLVAVLVAGRRQEAADAGSAPAKAALPWFHTAGALAVVNVFVAVLWI